MYWSALSPHLPRDHSSSDSGMSPTSSGRRSSTSVSARHGRHVTSTAGWTHRRSPAARSPRGGRSSGRACVQGREVWERWWGFRSSPHWPRVGGPCPPDVHVGVDRRRHDGHRLGDRACVGREELVAHRDVASRRHRASRLPRGLQPATQRLAALAGEDRSRRRSRSTTADGARYPLDPVGPSSAASRKT